MKKTLLSISFLLALAVVIYHRWISFNVFANGDYTYYFSATIRNLSIGYSWYSLTDVGSVNFTLWRMILTFSQSVFANYNYALNISEKFTVFWPTIIFANIISFVLLRKILKSNIGSIVGTIIFNYNTYYLVSNQAFYLYSSAVWVLLALLLFVNGLEKTKRYFYVLSTLSLLVAASYDFRVAYIGIFVLFFYLAYYVFFIKKFNFTLRFLKFIFFPLGTFFLFGLLNVYWVLPMFKLGSLTSNAVLDRGLFGNEFLNILYAITLFHPFWTGVKPAWFTVEPIMTYFWLIPIFAFLGMWLNRKDKNILFFGILAMLGIFLTKQVAHPFSSIYPWLYSHLPGFNAFREASKFYFIIALSYAVLIGALVSSVFTNFKHTKIYLKYCFVFFVAMLFLWNIKPILTGEINGIYTAKTIPSDYLTIKEFVLKDNDYYRTLWIPSSSTYSIYTVSHPKMSMASAHSEYSYWNDYISKFPLYKYSEGELMVKALNLSFSDNVLDESSIKYIFVPLQDKTNDEDFFIFYGQSRQYYINQLDKLHNLKKINAGVKDVAVYENKNYRPHVYITNNLETISKKIPYKNVDFKFVNPTQYQINIENIKEPFYLNFSEGYDNGWKVRVGLFNWIDAITKNNYFVSDKYHFENDANLNSFYINPEQICKIQNCKVNKDGTYNVSLTLYFLPQSHMYLGIIISGFMLFVIFSYLIFIFGKQIYAKRKI